MELLPRIWRFFGLCFNSYIAVIVCKAFILKSHRVFLIRRFFGPYFLLTRSTPPGPYR